MRRGARLCSDDDGKMHKMQLMRNHARCPACGSMHLFRLRRRLRDRFYSLFRFYPFKCDACSHRFWLRNVRTRLLFS